MAKVTCPDCGPNTVNHFMQKSFLVADWLMIPYFWPLESIRRRLTPYLFEIPSEKLTFALVDLFLKLRVLRKIENLTDKDTDRTRVAWVEAARRGIKMSKLSVFSWPVNFFVASYQKQRIIFEGLPRPGGETAESLEWMDHKDIMREKFKEAGIPVARGGVAWSKNAALKIFKSIGGAVITKPSVGSRSRHTTINVNTGEDLVRGFKVAKKLSPWVIIEEQLRGLVYRVTLLNGEVAAVLRREPPYVVGDGLLTVRELWQKENKNPKRQGPVFHHIPDGQVAEAELKRQGLAWQSVPEKDSWVFLNPKIGRSQGGSNTDVTEVVHSENVKLFEKIGSILADPLVGVDFIIADVSKPWYEQQPCGVIECNSLPFIDLHHYPLYGEPINVAAKLWDVVFPDSASK